MSEPYRFPGIRDFIAGEGINPNLAAKIPGVFFVARVVDAISQIPEAPVEARASMYAVARESIDALNAATKTVLAAFDAVMKECPPPEEAPAPKAAKPPPDTKPLEVPPPAATKPASTPLPASRMHPEPTGDLLKKPS